MMAAMTRISTGTVWHMLSIYDDIPFSPCVVVLSRRVERVQLQAENAYHPTLGLQR